MQTRVAAVLPAASLAFALLAAPTSHAQSWGFSEVTTDAGCAYQHTFTGSTLGPLFMGGGIAAGDVDEDGWVDLFALRGEAGPALLLRNRGDGTFEDRAPAAGLALDLPAGSGPVLADVDGDGHLDLVVGNADFTPPRQVRIFRGHGDGTFDEVTLGSGLPALATTFSASLGDSDGDGDLDLFLAQWNRDPAELLWRNDGGFHFSPATTLAFPGFADMVRRTFTANFVDADADGRTDLLLASDFGNSQVLHGQGDGTFERVTSPVISDENGMGAAVGDFDNDGDLDWFVSSIWDPSGVPLGNWGITGNRLYRNVSTPGQLAFEDATDAAGVRRGYWGWGSCFADFNNDGWLDVFHVNGWSSESFWNDPARLFVNRGDGTFDEQALARGIDQRDQGRGVVCFDYDRDGDVDLFIANNRAGSRLLRNDGGNQRPALAVELRGEAPNSQGIGAKLVLETGELTLVQEMRAGSNFVSQNPAIAHFGLGDASAVRRLTVRWPSGEQSELWGLAAGEKTVEEGLIFASGFETGDLAGWQSGPP